MQTSGDMQIRMKRPMKICMEQKHQSNPRVGLRGNRQSIFEAEKNEFGVLQNDGFKNHKAKALSTILGMTQISFHTGLKHSKRPQVRGEDEYTKINVIIRYFRRKLGEKLTAHNIAERNTRLLSQNGEK